MIRPIDTRANIQFADFIRELWLQNTVFTLEILMLPFARTFILKNV